MSTIIEIGGQRLVIHGDESASGHERLVAMFNRLKGKFSSVLSSIPSRSYRLAMEFIKAAGVGTIVGIDKTDGEEWGGDEVIGGENAP